jgi:catechol 2,3-dioxygenase-like lactoylglutathione lyase family enzyme
MEERRPDLHMLNLVVTDMAASVDFYRRLGVAAPTGGPGTDSHVQLRMPSGFSLELDTSESARWWHAGWRAGPGSVRAVLGFSLASRQAVDDVGLMSPIDEGRRSWPPEESPDPQ